ncbi:MAG: dihydroorotase [Paracoccus sp. (in: a-proteobacteria)]|uniref:dihydroorotase n=1 Tax=Paracoccus sp. TaxID=267 RepID=UPI0039E64821
MSAITDPKRERAVRGGRVVLPDGVVEADLVFRGGRVLRLEAPGATPGSGDIDARGLHVMAGMIDPHVHMRDPGQTSLDDFQTCTAAAAIGGVTTVFDMPNTVPAVASDEILRAKAEYLQPRARVDFALYGGAGASNAAQIVGLARAGAIAFKSFMNAPAPGAPEDNWSRCLADDHAFLTAMRQIAATGLMGILHAESEAICAEMTWALRQAGRIDPMAHGEARPPHAEEEAVGRAILLARTAGARIGIAHVSTAGALARIREARGRGQPVAAEVCPHHLLLTEARMAELGPYAKINPPLRPESDRAALWAALAEGVVDYIGSDHAPYADAAKAAGLAEIWRAPSGVHGVETVLPLLLDAAAAGRIGLPALTRLVSRNVARLFGLHPRKGELIPGADADFLLVDMNRPGRIDRQRLHSLSRDAARLWDGHQTRAAIVTTWLRGTEIAREGQILAAPGQGRFLHGGAAA